MVSTFSCPDEDRLRRLLAVTLPDADQADVVAHLDDCPSCQRRLERLAGNDQVLAGLDTALSSSQQPRDAALQRVLASFQGDPRPTNRMSQPSNSLSWVRSFLRPVESLDALGRLDDYEVTTVLGQGGMGIVLKAYDAALKRSVAVKLLAPYLAGDETSRQRFAREGQAAAAVRHEHIVTIHAVREANGLPYIVMEYLAGGSLQTYLQRHGPLDGTNTAHLGVQLADALAAAHARGLIHRDIKPSNILLVEDDPTGKRLTAKIGDFGLARLEADARLTQSGVLTGTPMYMAPEQARGEALDARADLFSFGSLLYTLCTGQEPFGGPNAMAVIRSVCEVTPKPIRDLNPGIPDGLAAIIERLHAKQPEDRFASAAEVAAALRAHLANPDQPGVRDVKPARRRSRRAWWALVIGTLLLGGTGAWLFHQAFHDASGAVRLHATLTGHTAPVWSVAFAPDGQTLATAGDDGTVRLWQAADGSPRAVLGRRKASFYAVVFAQKGRCVVAGSGDGALISWRTSDLTEQGMRRHRSGGIRRLAVAPNGATIAVVGTNQSIELWDVPDGPPQPGTEPGADPGSSGHPLVIKAAGGTLTDVVYAPDGRSLATADLGGAVKLWDPATGTEQAVLHEDGAGVRAIAFSPDGKTLATADSGDKDVKLWRVPGGEPLGVLHGHAHDIRTLQFAPGGQLLASSSSNGTIRLWDLSTAETVSVLRAHHGSVRSLAFSPDGRLLASAGEDRLAKIWDLSGLPPVPPE